MQPVVPKVRRLTSFSIDRLISRSTEQLETAMCALDTPRDTARSLLDGAVLDTPRVSPSPLRLPPPAQLQLLLQAQLQRAGLGLGDWGGLRPGGLYTAPPSLLLMQRGRERPGICSPGHACSPAHPCNPGNPALPWLLGRADALLPGRLPAAESAAFFTPFRKPKRVRTAFSPAQLLRLEKAFEANHYVVGQERKDLATRLGLTETQVKVWFQNRRTKYKRVRAEDDGAPEDEDRQENSVQDEEVDTTQDQEKEEDPAQQHNTEQEDDALAHKNNARSYKQDDADNANNDDGITIPDTGGQQILM